MYNVLFGCLHVTMLYIFKHLRFDHDENVCQSLCLVYFLFGLMKDTISRRKLGKVFSVFRLSLLIKSNGSNAKYFYI
jgi:hypothetical protein